MKSPSEPTMFLTWFFYTSETFFESKLYPKEIEIGVQFCEFYLYHAFLHALRTVSQIESIHQFSNILKPLLDVSTSVFSAATRSTEIVSSGLTY